MSSNNESTSKPVTVVFLSRFVSSRSPFDVLSSTLDVVSGNEFLSVKLTIPYYTNLYIILFRGRMFL